MAELLGTCGVAEVGIKKTILEGGVKYGGNFDETAARGWCTLWSPNSSLEPENGSLYLHRT